MVRLAVVGWLMKGSDHFGEVPSPRSVATGRPACRLFEHSVCSESDNHMLLGKMDASKYLSLLIAF